MAIPKTEKPYFKPETVTGDKDHHLMNNSYEYSCNVCMEKRLL